MVSTTARLAAQALRIFCEECEERVAQVNAL